MAVWPPVAAGLLFMGGWQQEVLSELVGHSFISSEERDRALSFTDDEANEVLASAIQVRPPTTAP